MARIVAASGIGEKGPACFVLEIEGRRLAMDFGEGPDAGRLPDFSRIGRLDAVFLSHAHPDHAGGLRFLRRFGDPPVFASERTLRRLDIEGRVLPPSGSCRILGLDAFTGRSGHTDGGLWLRLEPSGGVLYLGDSCPSSPLFRYDEPPASETVILDASYGSYDMDAEAARNEVFGSLERPWTVLPVPEDGRGLEIALEFFVRGLPFPAADVKILDAARSLMNDGFDYVRPEAAASLGAVLRGTPAASEGTRRGVVLASPPDAEGGLAGRFAGSSSFPAGPFFVLTGYIPEGTAAERLSAEGRALFRRWNVHPRLSENAALVRAVGAKRIFPAFSDVAGNREFLSAFGSVKVVLERDFSFS